MASVLFSYLSRTYQWIFLNEIMYTEAWCKLIQVFLIKKQAYQNFILPTEYLFSLQLIFVSPVLQYIF